VPPLHRLAVPTGALLALGLHMAALPWLASHGEWALLTVPSAWLLAWTAALWWLGRPWPISFTRGGGRTTWMLVGVALAVVAVLAFATLWPRGGGAVTIDRTLRGVVLLGVVPAAEELFFRGVLLADLRRRWGGFGATLLVTTIFAAMHAPTGQHLPMAVLSLLLCGVTLASRSVLWAVALHVAWNGLAVLKLLPPGADRAPTAAVTVALLVGIAAWGYARRERPEPRP